MKENGERSFTTGFSKDKANLTGSGGESNVVYVPTLRHSEEENK
jgi:hypothetical protein